MSDIPALPSEEIRPGTRWRKGQSGNPKGRPKGLTDRRQTLMKQIAPDLPDLLATVVRQAVNGDMQAAGLILARVFPPLKATEHPVRFNLDVEATLAGQAAQIVAAMASGLVAPDTCRTLLDSLDTLAAIRATEQLSDRVKALEESVHDR